MPALILEDIYVKSGRRDAFGANMFALKDRYNKAYVLGPTHEELFALAAGMKGRSYKDFPYNLYQIQTKYRDETRPRYGLIRTREFTMKDAYSFDTDLDGLHESYMKMFNAYCCIFDRLHLNYKIVKADTGAMGGLLSEEFQAICEIGEDIVVGCEQCDFSSNMEITEVIDTAETSDAAFEALEMVETPNAKTIEEVAAFFRKTPADFVKTLLYQVDGKEIVAFLLRGDRELNETKALKLLKANEMELASFADVERITKAKVGFAGQIHLEGVKIIMDRQIMKMKNFIVGANKSDHHYINANISDFHADEVADIALVKAGDICPQCKAKLTFTKGIEVGNTFKLGTKYADSLGLQYLDQDNTLKPVVMGSYGIGLERCMAAVAEQHHDEAGIIWPQEIAPFSVAVVVVANKDETQMQVAESLYQQLKAQGIDVLLDDRKERPGVKFKDMELIGIPYRITVGRRINEGIVELNIRGNEEKQEIALNEIVIKLMSYLHK